MSNQNGTERNNNVRNAALVNLVGQIQDENTKSYILDRIIPQMEWYSRNGRDCKKKYYGWMTVSIILGALIPIVSVFADGAIWIKMLLAALGSAATACNAYVTMHNYKDLWLTYRNVREKLLRILYCYFNNAGIFAQDREQEEKNRLLVDLCEQEMANEANEWMKFGK